ncbi:MAG: ABC transporter ATP-binding protein [Anaerolineales bacterium]|nr:ABC transporter ATP-binding protein [Anaerolineales bacterium]
MMLEIEGLTVAYQAHVALNAVSFGVDKGERLAVVGPNGAGKSTLIRTLSGVLAAQSGMMKIDGVDLSGLSTQARARLLSVVPQAGQLGGAFSVEQTVLLGRTAYMGWLGQPCSDDMDKVDLAIQRAHLGDLKERRIAELSGGERQRVLLARALAQDTPIMLLDEPTNHLDLRHQIEFLDLIRDLTEEEDLTVLMALHDLNLVSTYADRAVLLHEGNVVAIGETKDVLTTDHISKTYGVDVQVVSAPGVDVPIILPRGKDQ